MTTRNDGGPAFPRPHSSGMDNERPYTAPAEGGMNLRDWFAGQSIVAAVARSADEPFQTAGDLAAYLYELADAMIAERRK